MSSNLHVNVLPKAVRDGKVGSPTGDVAGAGDGLGVGVGDGDGDGLGAGAGAAVELAIVICRMPVTPSYVAITVVVPALTPPTIPAMVTVATPVLVDCHVACAVADCDVPLERFAVAANCETAPIAGAVPVTVTAETIGAATVAVDVGAVVDDDAPLHAAISAISPIAAPVRQYGGRDRNLVIRSSSRAAQDKP
jgi:hypothetical protein